MRHSPGDGGWGTASQGRQVGRARGRWSRCSAHLGSCGWGALVQSSSSQLVGLVRAERGRDQGKESAGVGRRRDVQTRGERGGGQGERNDRRGVSTSMRDGEAPGV
jgi:hypothetical protein